MKRERPIVKCKCKFCGFEWSFLAASKADARRMTGLPVCGAPDCKAKREVELDAIVASFKTDFVGIVNADTVGAV